MLCQKAHYQPVVLFYIRDDEIIGQFRPQLGDLAGLPGMKPGRAVPAPGKGRRPSTDDPRTTAAGYRPRAQAPMTVAGRPIPKPLQAVRSDPRDTGQASQDPFQTAYPTAQEQSVQVPQGVSDQYHSVPHKQHYEGYSEARAPVQYGHLSQATVSTVCRQQPHQAYHLAPPDLSQPRARVPSGSEYPPDPVTVSTVCRGGPSTHTQHPHSVTTSQHPALAPTQHPAWATTQHPALAPRERPSYRQPALISEFVNGTEREVHTVTSTSHSQQHKDTGYQVPIGQYAKEATVPHAMPSAEMHARGSVQFGGSHPVTQTFSKVQQIAPSRSSQLPSPSPTQLSTRRFPSAQVLVRKAHTLISLAAFF